MKFLMHFFGSLACLAVIAGALMKILHIKGGAIFLPLGLALFFFYLAARSYLKLRA